MPPVEALVCRQSATQVSHRPVLLGIAHSTGKAWKALYFSAKLVTRIGQSHLNHLATAISTRFQHGRNDKDLDGAIALRSREVIQIGLCHCAHWHSQSPRSVEGIK